MTLETADLNDVFSLFTCSVSPSLFLTWSNPRHKFQMWQNQVNCWSPNPRGRTTFAPLFPVLSTGGSQRLLCLFRVFQKASVVNGIEQILHYTRIFIATTRSFKYQNKLKTPQLTIITKTILCSWTIQCMKTEGGVSGRRLGTRISHNASRKEK